MESPSLPSVALRSTRVNLADDGTLAVIVTFNDLDDNLIGNDYEAMLLAMYSNICKVESGRLSLVLKTETQLV